MYACNNCGKESTKTGWCSQCHGDIIRTKRNNPEITERKKWFNTILIRAAALHDAKAGFNRAGGNLRPGTPGTSA